MNVVSRLAIGPQEPQAFAALEWPGDVRDVATAPWPAVGVGVLALAAAFWWWRRATRVPPAGPAVAPPAGPTALARLQALALPGEPAAAAAFYAQLKALLRLHCAERFGLRADVATSEELVRALPDLTALPACLRACDLVLFAAHAVAADEPAAARAAAIAWAMSSEPVEAA